jgi:hypothetical protein
MSFPSSTVIHLFPLGQSPVITCLIHIHPACKSKKKAQPLHEIGAVVGCHGSSCTHVHLSRTSAFGRIGLDQLVRLILERAVDGLLKDRFGLVDLPLALEVADVVGDAAAVGAAAGVCELEVLVHDFFAKASPVAFAATVLLHLLGIDVHMATLGEEARKVLCWDGSPVSETLVVAVVGLVGASHCTVMVYGSNRQR